MKGDNMDKEVNAQLSRLVCDSVSMLEGLAIIKEITHWREDSITDTEKEKLEWMIQPVLYDIAERMHKAIELLRD